MFTTEYAAEWDPQPRESFPENIPFEAMRNEILAVFDKYGVNGAIVIQWPHASLTAPVNPGMAFLVLNNGASLFDMPPARNGFHIRPEGDFTNLEEYTNARETSVNAVNETLHGLEHLHKLLRRIKGEMYQHPLYAWLAKLLTTKI